MGRQTQSAVALAAIILIWGLLLAGPACGQALKLIERAPDPHGSPRPARDATDVPLQTSLYFEVELPAGSRGADAIARRIAVDLQPDHKDPVELLRPGEHFEGASTGWLRPSDKSIAVYLETGRQLAQATRYTVHVTAGSPAATTRPADVASWHFTTEDAPAVHRVDYQLDLNTKPVEWHGAFFSGICNVIFCTRAANYGPTFELMDQAHKAHPRAWSLQRDFWLTGTEDRPANGFFPSNLPNIVRERETRRIAATQPAAGGAVRLQVEDFFGHEQYGIPSDRPVAADYHAGDDVLIADGIHSAHAKVLAADNAAHTVTVSAFETPSGGWKIAYDEPLPTREDSDGPGLFPPGGCYLRKYDPPGTPCYYWGRLDKEWDLAHRYGRRVLPNFADAPGDLSRDGKSWNTVKDYAEWHEAVRAITGHIIDRYGKDSLGFTWSIFNEPDLWIIFWHASWDDLQNYYDYTTDAILRAFEDRGYDSNKVFIGGLELGAIFGTNLKLSEFLAHCSPTAQAPGALPLNAAVADHRLDGKRSRRVEALCRAHGGKGAPCDFVSIHSYNRSAMMAAKLIRAKEIALQIDPDYYRNLWIDSHENCPDWMPPPDEAAGDVYLGDGYFPSWCADVVHRQLLKASEDPRFAFGETILTVWPPPDNFAALNAVTRVIHYRDANGAERTATVPMPILHGLNLLSDLGPAYWVLPERTIAGHTIGGFASRDAHGVLHALLYAHDPADTQSRSAASFDITLDLNGLNWTGPASLREYRFDRTHNSPYPLINQLLGTPRGTPHHLMPATYTQDQLAQIQAACQLQPADSSRTPDSAGHLRLTARLDANGCTFLRVAPRSEK
jgi:hypothetical protein